MDQCWYTHVTNRLHYCHVLLFPMSARKVKKKKKNKKDRVSMMRVQLLTLARHAAGLSFAAAAAGVSPT